MCEYGGAFRGGAAREESTQHGSDPVPYLQVMGGYRCPMGAGEVTALSGVGCPSNASCAHRDPDSVVLCVLATDEEDEGDIALQIHFTLIQAFCCDNDIHILRVLGMQRLATILGEPEPGTEPRDLHCLLVTVSWGGDARHDAGGPVSHVPRPGCEGAWGHVRG